MIYISQYGADRLLFGSDFPLWSPETELNSFMELKLSAEEQEKILYKNAMNLLGERI